MSISLFHVDISLFFLNWMRVRMDVYSDICIFSLPKEQ